jgi:hypothetical protein
LAGTPAEQGSAILHLQMLGQEFVARVLAVRPLEPKSPD